MIDIFWLDCYSQRAKEFLYTALVQSHASAAKAAVDSLTRTLALEWGEFGIRTNGIAPGIVTGTPGQNSTSFKSQRPQTSEALLCTYLANEDQSRELIFLHYFS